MLWTLAVIFFILWVLGLVHVFAIGPWMWLFLVIAAICLIAQVASGRRATPPPAA
ncbi:MAG: lmo0937 family membrane protein [Candidatus Korobacteraceae bacterium]